MSTTIIVENWGQQERQNFTWAMEAGDLGGRNRKSRKERGGHQSKASGPPCDWHGSLGWLCVFVHFLTQARFLLLKVIFQN